MWILMGRGAGVGIQIEEGASAKGLNEEPAKDSKTDTESRETREMLGEMWSVR